MNLRNMKKIQLQINEGHEIYSQYHIQPCFWVSLLIIILKDLNLILYIWVFNTTIEVIMRKIQFKQHFVITIRPLTKNIMVMVYQSIFWVQALEEIVSKSTLLATRPSRLTPKKCINKSIWLAIGGAPSMGTPRVPSGCQLNWFVYAFSWVRSPQRRVDLDTISSSEVTMLAPN